MTEKGEIRLTYVLEVMNKNLEAINKNLNLIATELVHNTEAIESTTNQAYTYYSSDGRSVLRENTTKR